MSGGRSAALAAAGSEVRRGLAGVNDRLRRDGLPELDVAGKLIRPVLSWGGRSAALRPGWTGTAGGGGNDGNAAESRFWSGVAAVQMAHEASLIHDDILDDAMERRGKPTVAGRHGVKRALVQGDHLLTAAYRLAADTGSLEFVTLFARCVERTVAGEKAQAGNAGKTPGIAEYERIVAGKSGELLGCALAVASALRGESGVRDTFELGRRIGVAYQMLDDLLDYVPGSPTGKAPWQDYRQRQWTWPLEALPGWDFGRPVEDVERALYEPGPDGPLVRRCLQSLSERIDGLRMEVRVAFGDDVVSELLADWLRTAACAVESACETWLRRPARALPIREHERVGRPVAARVTTAAGGPDGTADVTGTDTRARAALLDRLGSERWSGAMRRHARSFSFAARLFPRAQRRRVADVYAVCRFTDEIADTATDPTAAMAELDAWQRLCRTSYDGGGTGFGFLDRAMHDARSSGVPFACIEELVEGMRMDLRGDRYDTLADLDRYTWRVASVVGIWMTRMFGVDDPRVLDRAAALGRAMQLTNIVRDVGEDARLGRVYVPREVLARHGLTRDDVFSMAAGAPLMPGWAAAMTEMVGLAEREYARAFHAMPDLPAFFARPVAVAASVYRGIHDSLRDRGYDNFRHRAHTTGRTKIRLAARGLLHLRRVRRQRRLRDGAPTHTRSVTRPGSQPRHGRTDLRASARHVAGACLALVLAAGAPVQAQHVDTSNRQERRIEMAAPDLAERLRDVERRMLAEDAPADLVWERLGVLWLLGVEEEDAAKTGLAAVDSIETARTVAEDSTGSARLQAYRGAFRALTGKHAFWPHQKLDAVIDGLGHLDRAVDAQPADAQIRYLRLMTGFYLPGLFGRGDEVRSDLDALAELLPDRRAAFPPDLYVEVVRFVLENGTPTTRQRADLEAALAS